MAVIATAVVAAPLLYVAAKAIRVYRDRRNIVYEARAAVPPREDVLPEARAVTYTTDDGLSLVGWFVPAATGVRSDGANETTGATAPIALLFHGTGTTRAVFAPLARDLARCGVSSFLAEYRGMADSPGEPSERGLQRDAIAALAEVRSRPSVDRSRVVLVGHSLGTAVATTLAARMAAGPPADAAAGVVLLAPFTNLREVTAVFYGRFARFALGGDRYDLVGTVSRIGAPLVVVRTDADRVVPAAQSRRVLAAARPPKSEVVVQATGHSDPTFVVGDQVRSAVARAAGITSAC